MHHSKVASRHRNRLLALAIVAAPFALCSTASADRYWKNGITADTWSSTTDWSANSPTGTDSLGPPGSTDNADLTNTDALNEVITLDENDTIVSLQIGNTGGGTDTLFQTSPFNLSMSTEQVGVGTNSVGVHTQSAGTNSYSTNLIIGSGTASFGTYSLAGTGNVDITGSGMLGLDVGYNGSGAFLLSGAGSLAVLGNEDIGYEGSGTFEQTGGTNTVGGSLTLGSGSGGSGTYAISGGTLSATSISIGDSTAGGGTGTLTISGGQLSTPTYITMYSGGTLSFNLPGAYTFSGNTASGYGTVCQIGSGTTTLTGEISVGTLIVDAGTLSQTGGNHVNVNGTLSLNPSASGSAAYVLASGRLSAANEYLVTVGTGTFIQTGGSNIITLGGSLDLAYDANSTATYNLSSTALLTVEGNAYVGGYGTGTFNQSGGTVSIEEGSYLSVGTDAGGKGTYALSGNGVLNVTGNEELGYNGSGTLTQSGGTNSLSGSLLLAVNSGATANYLLSGGTLAVGGIETVGEFAAGTFDQSGGFHTVGTTASPQPLYIGIDSSQGTFILSGGTLAVSGSEYVGYGGTGTFSQSGGVASAGSLTISTGGTLSLSGGTLNAPTNIAGHFVTAGSPTAINLNGSLTLASTATTLAQLVGSTPSFGTARVNGNLALAGNLALFEDAGNEAMTNFNQTFIILEAINSGTLSGVFSNIASGQTLTTTDGSASFLVTINEGVDGDVVLSDFEPVPDPSAISLLSLAAPALLLRRKRRASHIPQHPRR